MLFLEGQDDVLNGQIVGSEFVTVKPEANLKFTAAADLNITNALQLLEEGTNSIVGLFR